MNAVINEKDLERYVNQESTAQPKVNDDLAGPRHNMETRTNDAEDNGEQLSADPASSGSWSEQVED